MVLVRYFGYLTVCLTQQIFQTRYFPVSLMAVIIGFAVAGNVLLFAVLYFSRRTGDFLNFQKIPILLSFISAAGRITSVHFLMMQNCLADLMFALVTMLPTLVYFLTAPNYYGGPVNECMNQSKLIDQIACHLLGCLRVVPMYASPFLLVMISIDRYWVRSTIQLVNRFNLRQFAILTRTWHSNLAPVRVIWLRWRGCSRWRSPSRMLSRTRT